MSNRGEEKLKSIIKTLGISNAGKAVGSIDNLFKVMNIITPMDFLHIYDDLDVIQSEKKPNWILFRYEEGDNLMLLEMKSMKMFVSDTEINSYLHTKSGIFSHDEHKTLLMEWLTELYDLKIEYIHILPRTAIVEWMRKLV